LNARRLDPRTAVRRNFGRKWSRLAKSGFEAIMGDRPRATGNRGARRRARDTLCFAAAINSCRPSRELGSSHRRLDTRSILESSDAVYANVQHLVGGPGLSKIRRV